MEEIKEGPAMAKVTIDVNSLTKLAIWLDGYKAGKGNLLPLGNIDLENLWNTVKCLQGDVRYKLPDTNK